MLREYGRKGRDGGVGVLGRSQYIILHIYTIKVEQRTRGRERDMCGVACVLKPATYIRARGSDGRLPGGRRAGTRHHRHAAAAEGAGTRALLRGLLLMSTIM